ncbi:Ig-like domain-containing protein [Pseudomonadota bacterium]
MKKFPIHPISLPRRYPALSVIITAALVAGCGGGGGGGSANPAGTAAAPVASASVLPAYEDQPTSSALSASDPDNDPLTFSIVSNGTMGNAVITDPATGAYTYTPSPDKNGVDNFTFKANDGAKDSNTATVTINITPAEDAPIARALSLAVNEDSSAQSALSASDVDNDPLIFSIVSNGSQGTAVITDPATGSFTYTPNANASGVDIFTFKANDGQTDSNPAAVTVSIAAVNDPPVAAGSCGTTPQAQTLAGTLQATDLETPSLLMYTLADGSTGPFTTAKGGEVTITNPTTGAFTYTPASLASGGDRGTDTFVFNVIDPDGGVDSATETVIVDLTIMPLGDSITRGDMGPVPPAETRVAYRKALYDRLVADGFGFDFVGTLNDGYGFANFDFNHEGHPGWLASDIAWGRAGGYPTDGVRAWLDTNPTDIVLLHIGTNDLAQGQPAFATAIDVESILDEIDLWESDNGTPVTVLLALIIDANPLDPDFSVFNSNVLAMANNRIANGDDIIVVNQHDALTYPDDMADSLHPTAGGYDKMAGPWFNELMNLVDKCP